MLRRFAKCVRQMTPVRPIVVVCLTALFLAGCSDAKRILTREKRAPDEFAVYQRAPLSLPPDFGLRPPDPGAGRPQDRDPVNQARSALGGGTPAADAGAEEFRDASPGTLALLRATGADKAEPGIRAAVDRETSIYAAEQTSIVDRIVFWQDQPEYGTVVNPDGEAKRIRENQGLGKPVNEGEVPVIEPDKKAIFEGVFN